MYCMCVVVVVEVALFNENHFSPFKRHYITLGLKPSEKMQDEITLFSLARQNRRCDSHEEQPMPSLLTCSFKLVVKLVFLSLP